ncbi:hypothetical protein MGA3_15986 [Bacillus methanolicus MGA3]|nr:hypothetical protein MGA3_15986 [Bacillus methanolicus MGA3]
MKKLKSLFAIISLFTLFLLAACGNNAEETATEKKENDKKQKIQAIQLNTQWEQLN